MNPATMHCPHAVADCPTCENSAAARELRDLRRVARAAERLVDRLREDGNTCAPLDELESMLTIARETSTFLPIGIRPVDPCKAE
jgi:hypothetical protein